MNPARGTSGDRQEEAYPVGQASRLSGKAGRLSRRSEDLLPNALYVVRWVLVVGGPVMRSIARRLLRGLLIVAIGCAGARVASILYPLPWFLHDTLIYFPTLFHAAAIIGLLAVAGALRQVSVRLLVAGLIVAGCNVAADLRLPRTGPEEPTSDRTLQLLSFNLYQARWADDEILSLVWEQRPDILFLQEVPRSFVQTHEEELRGQFRHVVYHNQLLAATNLDVRHADAHYLPHWRSLLHLVVEVEGKRLDVYNTHLSMAGPRNFFRRLLEQQEQTGKILERLAQAPGPCLVAGDFNLPLHSTCYRRLSSALHSARSTVGFGFGYTFNSCLPITAIDHCFGSPEIQFLRCQPLPVRLSDHRPVQVRFTIR